MMIPSCQLGIPSATKLLFQCWKSIKVNVKFYDLPNLNLLMLLLQMYPQTLQDILV